MFISKKSTRTKASLGSKAIINKDFSDIENHLNSRRIYHLYHFTAKENLESIRAMGGLYSWKYLEDNAIDYDAGGDLLSHMLDAHYHLEDYVRLSFCQSHPMAYRKHQEGKNIVVLRISLEAIGLDDVLFSDMNATDSMHTTGSDFEFLRSMNLEATQRKFVRRTDPDFKPLQAEVLVKRFLPIEFIENRNLVC